MPRWKSAGSWWPIAASGCGWAEFVTGIARAGVDPKRHDGRSLSQASVGWSFSIEGHAQLKDISASFRYFEPGMIENPFGFDHYLCEMQPHTWAMLAVYLTAIFMISGAFATRIGETSAPTRGVLAVTPVAAVAILDVATVGERIDVLSTAIVGLALLAGAVSCAFVGGQLAKRNA